MKFRFIEMVMDAIIVLKDVIQYMGMEFLYFPEDKTEYIPSVIILIIFMIGAGLAMYFFIKHSKKEEKKTEDQYRDIINKDTD
ncbi:hypothetical protein [Lentibacillus sp.]|uniref:hypothetical protein n=1 Tax=Lentibacillus sp. TaxID=1925746 RepID=UPI002B4AE3E9|nr:hypothetical protein [Lentibacillus sp.]HLS09678.1 hypothetical protein [Lentibacillus sp.]